MYRRRLKLARGTRWIARFEGAGHTTTVFVNGRRVGRHVGNYLPFEVDLPAGRSTLTVRVSSLRTADDLTHWRPSRYNRFGNGGWWNFGGIHREITVRPARGLDISRAQALPRLDCPTCPARVRVLTTVRNLTRRPVTPVVRARAAGREVSFPRVRLAPGQRRELATELTIARPRLWDIGRGNLYRLDVRARGGGQAAYTTWFGVRDLRKDAEGQVFLNGRRLRTRGISLHEDDARVGSAWRRPQLEAMLDRVRDLRASAVRAHYPMNPYAMEEFDRRGVLVWDTAPVNIVQNARWAKPRGPARRGARERGDGAARPRPPVGDGCSRSPTSCRSRSSARSSCSSAPRRRGCARWTRPGWWPWTGWPATTSPTTRTRCSAPSTRWGSTSTSAGTEARCPRGRRPTPVTSGPTTTACAGSSPGRPCS